MNKISVTFIVLFVINFVQSIYSQYLEHDNIEPLGRIKNIADTTTIYTTVDQIAQFPGGDRELIKYLAWNVYYPFRGCDVEHVEGFVVLRFVVEKDGCITNIRIIRSLGDIFDKEAIRVINSMPEWIPAKDQGEIVRAYFTLPVRFKIQR